MDAAPSPRLVFQRPRFSRDAVRFTTYFAFGILALSGFGGLQTMVIVGVFLGLAAPFMLLVWWRVGQRVELDADGITWVNRVGAPSVVSWADYAATRESRRHRHLPTYNWNGDELAMPASIADLQPEARYVITKPVRGAPATPLQRAAFLAFTGSADQLYFRMFDAALTVRVLDPTGDWPQQLAALFAARTACNGVGTNGAVPRARATGG